MGAPALASRGYLYDSLRPAGDGLVRLDLAYGKNALLWSLAGLTPLFVYMRDYAFLGWVLPEPARMSFLAMAG